MIWRAAPQRTTVDLAMLVELIACIDAPDFDKAVFAFVNREVAVEAIDGFHARSDAPPLAIGWCAHKARSGALIRDYEQRFYRVDPVMEAVERGLITAPMVGVLAARDVRDEAFRWRYFDAEGLRSRVSVVRPQEDSFAITHFFLAEERPAVAVVDQLAALSALFWPIAHRHSIAGQHTLRPGVRPMAEVRLIRQIGERFPSLTAQERKVCAFTIMGLSASEIGQKLAVTPATVYTYRRRAYERLGISSAHRLLSELV